jgi:CHAD domain-containing protein
MPDSSLNPAVAEFDLARLDEMIAALGRFRDVDLLKEHLQSARQYLMGAMPKEYLLNLEWARQALDAVPDSDIRSHMDDTIVKLIARMPAAPGTE